MHQTALEHQFIRADDFIQIYYESEKPFVCEWHALFSINAFYQFYSQCVMSGYIRVIFVSDTTYGYWMINDWGNISILTCFWSINC